MRKFLLIILVFYTLSKVGAQDIGVLSSPFPVSGCVLDTNEAVRVLIFNYGPDISTPISISYTINGGTPVTETPTSSLLSGVGFQHTFTDSANLQLPNSYELCYYTTVAGETNFSNDTLCVTVVSDALTIAGDVEFGDTVCSGLNSGTINLVGNLGVVQYWEYSETGGASWSNLGNNLFENYSNLTLETWYRTIVKNGFCPVDTSTIAIIKIDQPSIGGTLSGPDTVCSASNTGNIVLSGEFGTVTSWEFTENSGALWTTVSNGTNTEPFNNITISRDYRALVTNGSCAGSYSDTFHVEVVPGAVGGTLSAIVSSVCIGQNNTLLTLSGYSGTIDHWETSINGGGSWDLLINTADNYTEIDISVEMWYRVILDACVGDTSSVLILGIDQLSDAGLLAGDSTVCTGNNTGVLSLTGSVGTILDWVYSEDGGATWGSLMDQNPNYNYTNLASETVFMSIAQNGECPSDTSNIVTVSVFSNNFGVGSDTTINEGDNASLYAFGGAAYNWSPSIDLDDATSNSPIATPLSTTTYIVEITDTNTCFFVDSVLVTVVLEGVTISNLITANGDGFNDYWVIKGLENSGSISVKIINKKGVIVYVSENYLNDWNGSYQGNHLPTGTYFYIIEHPDINVITGHLNILSND